MLVWRDATADDAAFMARLDTSLWAWIGETGGLSAEHGRILSAMQAQARDRSYRQAWPDARCQVIEQRGADGVVPVGRVWFARAVGSWHLLDLTLAPEWRRQGLGEQVLRRLIAMAAADRLGLTLEVAADNPALRLYHRLGLRTVGEHPPYLSLHRPPDAGCGPGVHLPRQSETLHEPT